MRPIRFDALIDYESNRGVGTQTIDPKQIRGLYHFNKEATMFKVGDRVKVVGSPDGYRYYEKGDTGTIDSGIRDNGFDGRITDSYRVRLDSPENRPLSVPMIRVQDIKLITKGNDMEIEVGQVWEYVIDDGSYNGQFLITRVVNDNHIKFKHTTGIHAGTDNGWSVEQILKHCKLITNTKGDNKMEKKITPKGKNIKVDDYIYDRHCSNTGIVTALTKEHCVYDDCDTGEEHFRKYEYITLMINKPKIKLPKKK